MKPRKEWQWWEPRWSFRPRLWKEFKPFLNPWLWVRLELVVIVFLGFVLWLVGKFPEIELPLERIIPLALIVPPVLIGIPLIAYWLIPPMIAVSHKGILVMHGQSARWFLAAKIESVQLLLQVPHHPLLRVSAGKLIGTYGIGPKVDLTGLEAFIREVLPEARCERVAQLHGQNLRPESHNFSA